MIALSLDESVRGLLRVGAVVAAPVRIGGASESLRQEMDEQRGTESVAVTDSARILSFRPSERSGRAEESLEKAEAHRHPQRSLHSVAGLPRSG